MERCDLPELHYITPIRNVPSILHLGIVSHSCSSSLEHESVGMPEVQERRSKVVVPGGKKLHEYANLYLCARNPMMYKRKDQHLTLCVLRVSTEVLDVPGVVITDCNASSSYARFGASPQGLTIVNKELTFADDWKDPEEIQYFRKKSAKCAEVLVPDCVKPEFIIGAYVSCQKAKRILQALATGISISINGHLFFR